MLFVIVWISLFSLKKKIPQWRSFSSDESFFPQKMIVKILFLSHTFPVCLSACLSVCLPAYPSIHLTCLLYFLDCVPCLPPMLTQRSLVNNIFLHNQVCIYNIFKLCWMLNPPGIKILTSPGNKQVKEKETRFKKLLFIWRIIVRKKNIFVVTTEQRSRAVSRSEQWATAVHK